ncbi:hypothetical protein [Nocardia sp. NBC_00416]|uniref:hypothetical protein n=1 Tax=Nocardia sp. NBC_00416 TaxID=2975991 RepID=UPI002E245543
MFPQLSLDIYGVIVVTRTLTRVGSYSPSPLPFCDLDEQISCRCLRWLSDI